MDEPSARSTRRRREQLQEELLKIWAQTETTVVFVTHSIDEGDLPFRSRRGDAGAARPG